MWTNRVLWTVVVDGDDGLRSYGQTLLKNMEGWMRMDGCKVVVAGTLGEPGDAWERISHRIVSLSAGARASGVRSLAGLLDRLEVPHELAGPGVRDLALADKADLVGCVLLDLLHREPDGPVTTADVVRVVEERHGWVRERAPVLFGGGR